MARTVEFLGQMQPNMDPLTHPLPNLGSTTALSTISEMGCTRRLVAHGTVRGTLAWKGLLTGYMSYMAHEWKTLWCSEEWLASRRLLYIACGEVTI